jgi:hypothetical protein
MSFRQRSVTYIESFLRAFTRGKRYTTCFKFRFVSSPLKVSHLCDSHAVDAILPSQVPAGKEKFET